MMTEVHPLRVVVKAMVLFVFVNLIFALTNPPIGKITLYNYIFPGRLRFPYEEEPKYYFVGFNASVYEDFNAMFGAHIISENKTEDEFRLILLGDSATWGVSVLSRDTLSEQINALDLRTCDGRNIRAYNLGYPLSSLTRDFLILDKALEYEPDMILWSITLSTLEPKTAESYLIASHSERYLQLEDTYGLPLPQDTRWEIKEPTFYEKTIVGQRNRIKNIIFTQALGVLWAGTGIDNHRGGESGIGNPPSPDVENDPTYDGQSQGEWSPVPDPLMLDTLYSSYKMAGNVPIILLNQPIFIASGKNGNVRYNDIYPRWVYDGYRQFISSWAKDNGKILLDYWNAIPPDEFSGTHFHRNSTGEKHFAALLAPEILALSCQ